MLPQYDHQLISSFKEWLEYKLLSKGRAFNTIISGDLFSNADPVFTNYNVYTAPYHQWVYDSSISGAIIPTGVYKNTSLYGRGLSGLRIDFNHGRAIFDNGPVGNLKTSYSLKEFNVYVTTKSEYQLIAETQFRTLPIYSVPNSGLNPNSVVVPAVFIRQSLVQNSPWAFGGEDLSTSTIRCVVIALNEYQLIGIGSLLRDSRYEILPLLNSTPFNEFGDLKSGYWNYETARNEVNQSNYSIIDDVVVSRVENDFITQHHPNFYLMVIEFKIMKPRFPRQ